MNEKIYIGMDPDWQSVKDCREVNKVCADGLSLPFPDGSFDLVSSNMVLEHLADPVSVLREANRVLAKEGVLIIHTASSRHYMLMTGRVLSSFLSHKQYVKLISLYTGRKSEDIFPTRYKANTVRKLLALAAKAGFAFGFVSYLETPLDFPARMRFLERWFRQALPGSFKSTLFAVYVK